MIETGKITKIVKKAVLSEFDLEKAYAGDIVMIAGVPKGKVTHTVIE